MEINRTIYGFIFARGGSKGVKGKNIRPLSGKPLIAYSIQTGLECKYVDRVIVSTDDDKIASISKKYGAEVPFMRPHELAEDNSPEWLAWRHAIQSINENALYPPMDVFLSLPATSPFRSVEDIEKCIELFIHSDVDAVITVKNAARHPSFNMVSLDDNGHANLVMASEKNIVRRQDAPPIFDMTTVAYVMKPDFIMTADSLFEGNVKVAVIPDKRALDIDTELDFQFAEFLMSSQCIYKKSNKTD